MLHTIIEENDLGINISTNIDVSEQYGILMILECDLYFLSSEMIRIHSNILCASLQKTYYVASQRYVLVPCTGRAWAGPGPGHNKNIHTKPRLLILLLIKTEYKL